MLAFDYIDSRSKEVIVVSKTGEGLKELEDFLSTSFQPNIVYGAGKPADFEDKKSMSIFWGKELFDEKPTVYVCESGMCKLPTNKIEKAKELIEKTKDYSL